MDSPKPLRLATWNLCRHGGPDRTDLLREQQVDVLCAQEVTETAHAELLDAGVFDWGLLSLHHRPRAASGGRGDGLGVAIYGTHRTRLRASGIVDHLMRPEKFLYVEIAVIDDDSWRLPITVASYHAAPGPGKPECTLQVAHWCELRTGPIILGCDTNSPWVDHPDHEQSQFCWEQAPTTGFEAALIGPPSKRRHRLEDALRTWTATARADTNPDVNESNLPVDGPLATTYNRDTRHGGFVPCRYDSIWATPNFQVHSIDHLWDNQTNTPRGGSDHAMVLAELTPAAPPRRKRQTIIAHLREHHLIVDGTPLRFNLDCVPDGPDRLKLTEWAATHPELTTVTWHNDTNRVLRHLASGERFAVDELTKRLCADAGIDLPRSPASPHWWRDEHGRTLVQISEGR